MNIVFVSAEGDSWEYRPAFLKYVPREGESILFTPGVSQAQQLPSDYFTVINVCVEQVEIDGGGEPDDSYRIVISLRAEESVNYFPGIS